MSRLLRFEFRKLFMQKSFYICTSVLIFLTIIPVAVARTMSDRIDVSGALAQLTGVQYFVTGLSGSGIITILAIIIPIFVCGDYSSGTIKNIIGKGYRRDAVFFSKYVAAAAATAIICAVFWITAFAIGTFLYGMGSGFKASMLLMLITQLLVAVAYASIHFAISALLKKKGAAIALCILTPTIVSALLSLASIIVALNGGDSDIGRYWLSSVFKSVSAMSVETGDLLKDLACTCIYIIVFAYIGISASKRAEV